MANRRFVGGTVHAMLDPLYHVIVVVAAIGVDGLDGDSK